MHIEICKIQTILIILQIKYVFAANTSKGVSKRHAKCLPFTEDQVNSGIANKHIKQAKLGESTVFVEGSKQVKIVNASGEATEWIVAESESRFNEKYIESINAELDNYIISKEQPWMIHSIQSHHSQCNSNTMVDDRQIVLPMNEYNNPDQGHKSDNLLKKPNDVRVESEEFKNLQSLFLLQLDLKKITIKEKNNANVISSDTADKGKIDLLITEKNENKTSIEEDIKEVRLEYRRSKNDKQEREDKIIIKTQLKAIRKISKELERQKTIMSLHRNILNIKKNIKSLEREQAIHARHNFKNRIRMCRKLEKQAENEFETRECPKNKRKSETLERFSISKQSYNEKLQTISKNTEITEIVANHANLHCEQTDHTLELVSAKLQQIFSEI